MSGHIFRYEAKIQPNPFCRTGVLKRFESKENAMRWVLERRSSFGSLEDTVFIEEREYTSEANLKRDFTLYCRVVWGSYFHGYEALERMMKA